MAINLTNILTNVTVAAVVGGISGSVAMHLLGECIAYRKSKKTLRLQLLYELSAFYHEYISEIEAVHKERSHMVVISESSYHCPAIHKLDGRLMEFQLRVWKSFPQRIIRATFTKFINRLERVAEFHLGSVQPDFQKSLMAIGWADVMYTSLLSHMADICGVSMKEKGKMMFLISEKSLRELSFEDEPVPWEFAVIFPSCISESCDKNKVTETLTNKFGNLQCAIHGRPVQIFIRESQEHHGGLTFTITTCCETFGEGIRHDIRETLNRM